MHNKKMLFLMILILSGSCTTRMAIKQEDDGLIGTDY